MVDNRSECDMMSLMRKPLALILIALGALTLFLGVAGANVNPGVCSGTHLFPPNETTKLITVTAPEGQLISGYCVKAGSLNQGNGPVYVTVDPAAETVTISHPSGKDISHYTVTYVDKPDETTTTTTTTVPEEETTTTTVPQETTTTVREEPTTTTTAPEETTTTSPEETTTTVGAEETTVPDEPRSPTQSPRALGGSELPVTGSPSTYLMVLGVVLLLAGTGLSVRYR